MTRRREVVHRVLVQEVGIDRLECICEHLDVRFEHGRGLYPDQAHLLLEFPWLDRNQAAIVLDYWKATYARRTIRDALLVR